MIHKRNLEITIKNSLEKGFDKGYFYALNGIKEIIKATGKAEAVISIELIDEMIKISKEAIDNAK